MRSGSIGLVRIYGSEQLQAIALIVGMGFDHAKALAALLHTKFDLDQAGRALTIGPPPAPVKDALQILPKGAIGSSAARTDGEIEGLDVFNAASDMIIDDGAIGVNELEFLANAALQSHSNIRSFSVAVIIDLLLHILPRVCFLGNNVPLTGLTASEQQTVQQFLPNFWRYALGNRDVINAVAQVVAICPSATTRHLMPLSRLSNLIALKGGGSVIPPEVESALTSLGANVVDSDIVDTSSAVPVFWEYVHPSNRTGVLNSFGFIIRESRGAAVFESLNGVQREALRLFIATSAPIKLLTGPLCGLTF